MEVMIWIVVLFAMSLLAGAYFNGVEIRQKNRVRQMYIELVKEKLDIVRTALGMGYSDQALAELDQRLEKLIGTEKMLETLRAEKPAASAELPAAPLADTDLELELRRAKAEREKKQ